MTLQIDDIVTLFVVRICLVKQWPHITVYTAYHYRLRKSMTSAPAGTIILCPSANIICIGTIFSQISFEYV